MSDDVNIRISATDNATATLRAVQAQLTSFSASVKNFASIAIGGFGLQQVTQFLTESVKSYAESERAVTMLDRVLKSTGNTIKMTRKEIQDYATLRMGQTVFDDDAIIEAASQMAKFRDISGDTFREAMDAAQDLSTVMGTDLVTAAQTLGRALSDPVEGMSKLARAGIVFTEQQKNQIKLLGVLGDKAGQQRIILNEANRVNAGAAAADAKTPGGMFAQVKNEIGELMEDVGRKIFPSLKAATDLARANFGGVPGAAAGADALLAGPRGAAKGSAAEMKRLADLKASYNAIAAEINTALARPKEEGAIKFFASVLQNFADAAMFQRNQVRLGDLKEEIAIQAARAARASQGEVPSALMRSLLGVGTQGSAGLMTSLGGLTAQQNFLGVPIGTIGDKIARDLNLGGAAGLLGNLNEVFGQTAKDQAETTSRSLQATESRFLTRGRGQLSPEAKKAAEDNARQLAELKGIRDELRNLGENILVVEGVA